MGSICTLLAIATVPLTMAERMGLPTEPIRETLVGLCQTEQRHRRPKGDIFENRPPSTAPTFKNKTPYTVPPNRFNPFKVPAQ